MKIKTLKRMVFRKRRTTKKKPLSKTQKKQVKRIVNGKLETMRTCNFAQAATLFTPSSLGAVSCTLMIPTINSGTTEGTRKGNKINLVRHYTKCRIYIPNGLTATEPIMVRCLVIQNKQGPSALITSVSDLFRDRTGTFGPQANDLDMLAAINTYQYRVAFDKIFKIGQSNVTGTNLQTANNDFSLSRVFSINLIKHIKKLQYNDQVTNYPTNENWNMFFLMAKVGGSSFSYSVDSTLRLTYYSDIRYKDA